MKSEKSTNTSGITSGSILGLIFITLKLCGVIHWSWIWVLCPFWIVFAIIILALVISAIIVILQHLYLKIAKVSHEDGEKDL
jgi:hypothetical protein